MGLPFFYPGVLTRPALPGDALLGDLSVVLLAIAGAEVIGSDRGSATGRWLR